MATLWVYLEDGEQGWKQVPGFQGVGKDQLHRVADDFNKKYCSRHYWVSGSKPGETEYSELVEAKRLSGRHFVDGEVSLL